VSSLGRGKVCFRKTFYFKQEFSKLVQYQHVINLENSVGGDGFEDMTVEEIKELTVNKKNI
jgi:hypothetical protein